MEKLQPWLRWIAGVAIVALALFAMLSPHKQDPVAVAGDPIPSPLADQPSGGPVSASPFASSAPAPSPTVTPIAVYVCGAVKLPGVYRLAASARVIDAVHQAGGLRNDADPEAINLAQPLTDGMMIAVPKKGQQVAAENAAAPTLTIGAVAFRRPESAGPNRHSGYHRGSAAASTRRKLQPGETVNINTAPESDLMKLPGVGPGLARRIIEYRAANGPFQTVDDLQNVSGIGGSKFARIQPFVHT